MFKFQVIDGTPCDLRDGLRRVCVEGDCKVVGCDGMLGSDIQEDNCRICGGNGANCNTVTGELLNKVKYRNIGFASSKSKFESISGSHDGLQ